MAMTLYIGTFCSIFSSILNNGKEGVCEKVDNSERAMRQKDVGWSAAASKQKKEKRR